MADLRGLTIRQPWASLIAAGVKSIETRSRRTSYRGPVLIHAGVHRPDPLWTAGDAWMIDTFRDTEELCVATPDGQIAFPLPLGAVVAVADLVDCVPIVETDFGRKPDEPCVHTNPVQGSHMLGLWSHQDLPSGSGIDYRPCGLLVRYITDQLPLGDFTPGRWAWLLDNVRPLAEPISAKGRQGLWRPDAAIIDRITEESPDA